MSSSIQNKMYKVLPRLQNQPGLTGHWQTCPYPQKPSQRREEAPPRLRQLHIFLRLSYILKFITSILLDCCVVVDVRLHWDASVLDIQAWNNFLSNKEVANQTQIAYNNSSKCSQVFCPKTIAQAHWDRSCFMNSRLCHEHRFAYLPLVRGQIQIPYAA